VPSNDRSSTTDGEDGCLVVIDVLSFTTAVTVATGRGIAVLPCRLSGAGAEALAATNGSELAVQRRDMSREHLDMGYED
jgi:hypothetical protein